MSLNETWSQKTARHPQGDVCIGFSMFSLISRPTVSFSRGISWNPATAIISSINGDAGDFVAASRSFYPAPYPNSSAALHQLLRGCKKY